MPDQPPTGPLEHGVGLAQRDPEVVFASLAAELGIIKAGDKLDQMQIDFAFGVAELCASIGDRYGDPCDGNAGEHIRAVYGPV